MECPQCRPSITDKITALDKESQPLQQTYEALQKANRTLIERKTELQKKLQEVNEEVKEARKQLKDLGDEASSDAFKDYYGGLYSDVSGRSGEMVGTGSTLASGRETDLISFNTMFKDKQIAQDYLADLVNVANVTPFLYDDLVSMSKTLATYSYSGDKNSEDYILPLLQTIGDAGAALGMGASDMNSVAQALGP